MKHKKLLITVVAAAALAISGLLVYGFVSGNISKGNLPEYSVSNAKEREGSMLKGKSIIFLGSSVTHGSAAGGKSFVEFLEKCDGIIPYKEAVPGTTLVDNGEKSYVARMKTIPAELKADAFVCQLSTNDASKKLSLGKISDSTDVSDFDTSTVIGAIEYIIAYAESTWNCPVVFYTVTKYDSAEYSAMVTALDAVREKWGITVLDLWNSEKMKAVSDEDYALYMADPIHPTSAGYGEWWLPEFEACLEALIG